MMVSEYCVWAIATQNQPTEPNKLIQSGRNVHSEKKIFLWSFFVHSNLRKSRCGKPILAIYEPNESSVDGHHDNEEKFEIQLLKSEI